MTEELISRLSQIEQLQVKSRTAVQRLRGRPLDNPAALGRSLGVANLVSGSVLRSRGRLRINVELTRIATGNSVWSRSFDRPADDLIRAQAEIAESVAVNVGARLAPEERRLIASRPTRSAAAYDHVLRGRFAMSRRTTASILAAAREFEAAIRLDSGYASAWTNLGTALMILSGTYYSPDLRVSRDSLYARGRAAVDRAVVSDSTSVEALVARAIAYRYNSGMQRSLMARAVVLEPRNPDAHHYYGLALRHTGELEASARELRRAVELEPDRVISLQNLGQTLVLLRQPAEAVEWLDSAVALRPDGAFFYVSAGFARLLAGDTAGARALGPLMASHGAPNGRELVIATIEARAGDTARAQSRAVAVDSAMRTRECVTSHDCLELAMTLAATGLRDRALAVFERIQPRDAWIVTWAARPELDLLRNEPRFRRVLDEATAAATAR